jgi:Cys-tRNA(Pro) deacylase
MAKDKPTTRAVRVLKENKASFSLHTYRYEEHGGTEVAANALGVDEHLVIKTLVFEDDSRAPLILLMHGDRQASAKALARTLGVKTVGACEPRVANRHTGYTVGGISPFGTTKPIPVFVERSIQELPRLFINAGKRGLLAEIPPAELVRILNPTPVDVAI